MKIIDNTGVEVTLDELNERAKAWRVAYDEAKAARRSERFARAYAAHEARKMPA